MLALLLAVPGAAAVAQAAKAVSPVPSRLTRAIDESQLVPLKGTVHRLASATNDRGAADDGLGLDRIQVVLKRSDAQELALKQLIQEMHTPGTANFHQWLTPEQFGKQFGPSDEDVATLSAWLTTHGFTVTKLNPGRQTLEISGTAGQFKSTFHAQIHKYQVNGETHFANSADPSIPAALAPVFGGFAPLNNFRLKNNTKVLGKASYDPKTHVAVPSWTVGSANAFSLALAPGDFAVQYNLNPLYTAGVNGTGQTIAIINDANVSIPLVNQYRSLFGLPANPPAVIIDGFDPGIDGVNNPEGPNGDSVEAYLDVEVSGSVAPNAIVDLVIAGDTEIGSGLEYAAERAVYSNIAPVLSLSFGSCEAALGASGNAFWSTLWQQAAAQGQTVMVSTGDAGSGQCDQNEPFALFGQEVSGFASTPYNVAVGGTDFYYSTYNSGSESILSTYWNTTPSDTTPTTSLLKTIPEQPWNDSQFGLNFSNYYKLTGTSTTGAGAGGMSNCATGNYGSNCAGYPKPLWQKGTGVPADGVRDIPDVSLFAANGLNFSYYPICAEDGDCQPVTTGEVQIFGVGGTSASTPAFAGIMALVNQKYGPQGQADFILYPLAKQFPTAFNDVTAGTNTVPCNLNTLSDGRYSYPPTDCITAPAAESITINDSTFGTVNEGEIGNTTTNTPEYNAGVGYDLASGLGTINADVLVTNWGSVKLVATTTTLTPSATTIAHGTAITVSGNVTPSSATGVVELVTTSPEPLVAGAGTFALASGAYSGSVYLPGGSYTIYASYAGDGTNGPSTSTPVEVTVSPEASKVSLGVSNVSGFAVGTSAALPYGTQLVLTATPAPNSGATTDGPATGTVTFYDGTTVLGTSNVGANGTATFNYAPLVSATAHSVTASYSGDSSYSASKSTAVAITIVQDVPDLNLYSGTATSSAFSAAAGGTTLTAIVSNSANDSATSAVSVPVLAPTGVVTMTGLPSGTLTFPSLQSAYDAIQSQNPGTSSIEGVAVTGVPSGNPAKTYTVTLSYPGDANYSASSASGAVTITAGGTASTTSATASPAATSTTKVVTLTITVTGQSGKGVPSGTIDIFAAGYDLTGSLTLPSGSGDSVSFPITFSSAGLVEGVNTLTVQYSGNTTYAPSAGTVTVTNGATATFGLSSSGPISVAAGTTGTSTILVTPVGGFTGAVALSCAVTPVTTSTPTCTVAAPGAISGISPVPAVLTLTSTAATTTGTYVVTVTGTSGNLIQTTSVPVTVKVSNTPSFALSNSGPITVTVGATTGNTSTITVTPSSGFTGAVVLSCAVTPATAVEPTCAVGSPATITGTAAVSSTLTVSTTGATPGTYTVTVTGVNGSTSKTTAVGLTVNAVPVPGIALSNSGAITVTQGVNTGNTSTITVTASGGFTGAVALTCAVTPTTGTSVPTCAVSPASVTTSGTSTLTVTTTGTTTAGPYTVTVSGTATGVTTATTAVALTVNPVVVATPTIALTNSGPITITSQGGSGVDTITVTTTGGLASSSVALSCAVSPTNETATPTCSVGAVTNSMGSGGSSTAVLTVGTTASAAMEMPKMQMLPIGGGVAAAALLFFLAPVRRRRLATLLGAVVLMALVGFSAGCGGGSSHTNTGTTTGAYSVTVTGTATGVTAATTTVTVTVQ